MPTIRTADGTELFCRDWGRGQAGRPVVFVAGWSLPSDSWGYQMMALLEAGHRVAAYDRRGHGRSDDPGGGYDLDTLADDLGAVLDALDLREVLLVGHSMGCSEILRYLGRHGSARVAGAALLGTMTPCLLRGRDNPGGIDAEVVEAVQRGQLMVDFPQWIDDNMAPFVLPETRQGMRDWLRGMALGASVQALVECNRELARSDFRAELAAIGLPILLIAGARDASAPPALTAEPTAALLPHARLQVYEDAPHGMFVTHMARVNRDLLEFAAGLGHNRPQS